MNNLSLENINKSLISRGQFEFFGLPMTQIPEALVKISTLLRISNPSLILEFGTGYGGLSVLLNLYSKLKNCNFCSYDVSAHKKEILSLIDPNFILAELNDPKTINDIIVKIKNNTLAPTILFCDALKSEEAKRYSKYLKPGDLILIHDYHSTSDIIRWLDMSGRTGWTASQEQYMELFKTIITDDGIQPVFHDEFEEVLWFCGIKK